MRAKGTLRWILNNLLRSQVGPALLTFIVYVHTLAPGVYGYDSAELATGVFTLGIVHPTGYPLYLLVGKAFTILPLGSVAFRLNLMSAVFASATVWITARLTQRLTKRPILAALGALGLGFAPSFWSLAVVAEVYTLHTFLIATSVTAAVRFAELGQRRWLWLLAMSAGLSIANHMTSAMYLPAYALIASGSSSEWSWRTIAAGAGLFLIGPLLYLYLPIRDAAGVDLNYVRDYYDVNLRTLEGVLWMATGQAYRFFAFAYGPVEYLKELAKMGVSLWRNSTGLGLLFGGIGFVAMVRSDRRSAIALGWIFTSTIFFFAGYAVADKLTMILPAYVVLALWVSTGATSVTKAVGRFGPPGPLLPYVRSVAVGALALMILLVMWSSWDRVDKSRARGAELFALQTLGGVQEGAVLVSEWSSAVTLEYFQKVEGVRPDVQIFNRSRFEVAAYYRLWKQGYDHSVALAEISDMETAAISSLGRGRPVYGTEYDPILASEYEYLPSGNVFQMVPRTQNSN